MTAIRIEVLGIPVPQGSAKGFPNRKTGGVIVTHDNPRLRAWRDLVAKAASDAMLARGDYLGPYPRPPMDCAVGIDLQVFLPRPKSAPKRKRLRHQKRPDLDKVIRGILDALTSVVFRDDSQVCEIAAQKHYDYDHAPGIVCVVYPIPSAPHADRPAAPPTSPEIPIPAAGPRGEE